MIVQSLQLSEQNFVYTEQQEKVRQEFFEVTDMVVLILSNLSGKDLEACLRIKKKFYVIILQSKSLRNFLFFERGIAKTQFWSGIEGDTARVKIASLNAVKNITKALEYVSELPTYIQHKAWSSIIPKIMNIDLEKTKSIIKQIENPETRHTCWTEVLKIEKNAETFDELEKSVKGFDSPPHPRISIELYGYTKKEEYLERTLYRIDNSRSADYKFECLLELFKVTKSIEYLQQAKECLKMISDDSDLSWDYLELSKIEDKEEYLEKAKKAAEKIASPDKQFNAWINICKENVSEELLTNAKACAHQIEHPQIKRDAWLKIIKQEIEQNLESAKITTFQIEDDFYRAKAWIEIFKKESSYENLQKILACIRNISEISQRALLWIKLSRLEVGF